MRQRQLGATRCSRSRSLGTALGWLIARRRAFLWTLLLWLPVPFYAYSVAYGSVPIFLPVWWPHSWYNTRYGMELLPAFALGLGFAAQFVLAAVREFKPRLPRYAASLLFALIALNAAIVFREQPLVYVEGTKNIESRRPFEEQIPPVLRSLLADRPGGISADEYFGLSRNSSRLREFRCARPSTRATGSSTATRWPRPLHMPRSCWRSTATKSTRPFTRTPPDSARSSASVLRASHPVRFTSPIRRPSTKG